MAVYIQSLVDVDKGVYEAKGTSIILPFAGYIPRGIHKDTKIFIEGKTHPNFNRFSINLCTGPNLDQDCALHFNPRFYDGKVVINHKLSGKWIKEKIVNSKPFASNTDFTITVRVTMDCFQIEVNDHPFKNYKQHIDKGNIHYVFIAGDCSIRLIQVGDEKSVPTVSRSHQDQVPTVSRSHQDQVPTVLRSHQDQILLPYSQLFDDGIHEGTEITIKGITHLNLDRFSVNLCMEDNLEKDCAFHFNPRSKKGIVVRNHKQSGKWGKEEFSGGMPFAKGHPFTMSVTVEKMAYKIQVNNFHFCTFKHRLSINLVKYIYIAGDCNITSLDICNSQSRPAESDALPPRSA